jgi:hypothetical protein
VGAVTFTVTLRTDGSGAYRRLRRLLKTALRRDRLKAIDVHEHTARVSRCRTAPAVRTTQGRRGRGDKTMDASKYAGAGFLSRTMSRMGSIAARSPQ